MHPKNVPWKFFSMHIFHLHLLKASLMIDNNLNKKLALHRKSKCHQLVLTFEIRLPKCGDV